MLDDEGSPLCEILWVSSCDELRDEVNRWQSASLDGMTSRSRDSKGLYHGIHQGFIKLLKWKEPNRVVSLLRAVSRRLRNSDCDKTQLRWSEKKLKHALDHWVGAVEVDQPDQDMRPRKALLRKQKPPTKAVA